MIDAIIAGALLLFLAAVAYFTWRRSRSQDLPAPLSVRYTNHARERMRERLVSEAEIETVLAGPARSVEDPANRSVRLERDFGDRTLKVWVASPWPSVSVVVKTTAWSYSSAFRIPAEAVGLVIGRKGRTIEQLRAESGAQIRVEDGGAVHISADTKAAAEMAWLGVQRVATRQTAGLPKRIGGTVTSVTARSAILLLPDGRTGELPVKNLRPYVEGRWIDDVRQVLKVGQDLVVVVREDGNGRILLEAVGKARA